MKKETHTLKASDSWQTPGPGSPSGVRPGPDSKVEVTYANKYNLASVPVGKGLNIDCTWTFNGVPACACNGEACSPMRPINPPAVNKTKKK